MRRLILLSLAALASIFETFGIVVDVPHTFNGHTYDLLDAKSWTASQAEAVAMGGNLVSVNSEAEWIFLVDKSFTTQTVSGPQVNLWLGLQDQNNDEVYTWISGEAVTYTRLIPPNPATSDPFVTVENPPGFQGRDPNNPDASWDPDFVAPNLTWSDELDNPNFHGIVEVAPSAISLSIGSNPITNGGGHGFGSVDLGNIATVTVGISNPAQDLDVACDEPAKTDLVNAWIEAHGGAAATDHSGSVTWTHNSTVIPALCDPVSVTFTASDPEGNMSTTSAQLTTVDHSPPVIDVPAAVITVETDGQGNAAALNAWLADHGGASATDTCGEVSWSHNFTGLDGTSPPDRGGDLFRQ